MNQRSKEIFHKFKKKEKQKALKWVHWKYNEMSNNFPRDFWTIKLYKK